MGVKGFEYEIFLLEILGDAIELQSSWQERKKSFDLICIIPSNIAHDVLFCFIHFALFQCFT